MQLTEPGVALTDYSCSNHSLPPAKRTHSWVLTDEIFIRFNPGKASGFFLSEYLFGIACYVQKVLQKMKIRDILLIY